MLRILCYDIYAGNCMATAWWTSTFEWWSDISWDHWPQALYGGPFSGVSTTWHDFDSFGECPMCCLVQKDSLPLCRSLKSWISAHQPPMAPRPDLPLKGMPYFTANSCPSWTSVVLLLNCLEVSWLIGWSLFYLLQLLAVFATSSVCCTVLYASQSYRLQHLILTIDFKFEELSWDSRSEICQCWI